LQFDRLAFWNEVNAFCVSMGIDINVLMRAQQLQRFDFCLSPRGTKAVHTILPRRLSWFPEKQRQSIAEIEISAEAMAVAEGIAMCIHRTGGMALIIDYGQSGPYKMSLNAIREHKPVHPLQVGDLHPIRS
jgi:SAM-dependent MidA family methyltransferase